MGSGRVGTVLAGRNLMSGAPPFDPRPVTLEGGHVRLEPLALGHAGALAEGGRDPALWRFGALPPLRTEADARAYVVAAVEEIAAGRQIVFAIVHRASGRAIGSTRYGDIRRRDRALEIGWTWIAPEHQRTPVNTECKYLLLRHAFESLGAVRVQFKTDARNERSRRALERIGAALEGILRRHMILPDGHIRDSAYYGITDLDWPVVKGRLERLMAR